MSSLSIVKTALRSISANKIRSILTTLGIVIGIAAVIALLSLGRGAEAQILQEVEGLGASTIIVLPVSNFNGPSSESSIAALLNSKLDHRVVEKFDNKVKYPELETVSPEVSKLFEVSHRSVTKDYQVYGVREDFFDTYDIEFSAGTRITAEDNNSLRRIAVLGPDSAEALFGEDSVVGKEIKIDGSSYTVVGVMKPKNRDLDERVMVPLQTASNILIGEKDYSQVYMKVSDENLLNSTAKKIEDELLDFYRVSDAEDAPFTIFTSAELLSLVGDITSIFTTLLASIAGISLLVGGIGIMNIMLVSVTERTKEIGLRKAVGAKESAIMAQFLTEALLLTVIGGAIGIIVGFAFAQLASTLGGIPALYTFEAVALATSVSAFIGVVFGFYPAYRAAILNPIDALRYE